MVKIKTHSYQPRIDGWMLSLHINRPWEQSPTSVTKLDIHNDTTDIVSGHVSDR